MVSCKALIQSTILFLFLYPEKSMKESILDFYPEEPRLRELLLIHSSAVADKAVKIALSSPDLNIDLDFVKRAALLHDIGIRNCNAPGIFCFGSLPYICHGVEGAKMLAEKGLFKEAFVCERHTGSGLTAKEIHDGALPLPERDMLPVTLEEKLICYADKFYSKHPDRLSEEKSIAQIISEMKRHGEEPLRRFMDLHNLFAEPGLEH